MRGNTYSRQHEFLEPDTEPEFWDFSFEEFGSDDLMTAIDYILSVTDRE